MKFHKIFTFILAYCTIINYFSFKFLEGVPNSPGFIGDCDSEISEQNAELTAFQIAPAL